MTTNHDNIYAKKLTEIVDFKFDEKVASVFPDMIKRSVPGYASIIKMISVFAEKYAKEQSNCYDLGCSLGAATLALRHGIKAPGCHIYAVDNSMSMLKRCHQHIDFDSSGVPVALVCADICDIKIKTASIVVFNFTLQFIEPNRRLALLSKIYKGLLPGGVLILSEKTAFGEKSKQQFFTDLHLAFKIANGYSDLEISQKRTALENVMIPETISTHRERLYNAGFAKSEVWFQSLNFVSIIAVK